MTPPDPVIGIGAWSVPRRWDRESPSEWRQVPCPRIFDRRLRRLTRRPRPGSPQSRRGPRHRQETLLQSDRKRLRTLPWRQSLTYIHSIGEPNQDRAMADQAENLVLELLRQLRAESTTLCASGCWNKAWHACVRSRHRIALTYRTDTPGGTYRAPAESVRLTGRVGRADAGGKAGDVPSACTLSSVARPNLAGGGRNPPFAGVGWTFPRPMPRRRIW